LGAKLHEWQKEISLRFNRYIVADYSPSDRVPWRQKLKNPERRICALNWWLNLKFNCWECFYICRSLIFYPSSLSQKAENLSFVTPKSDSNFFTQKTHISMLHIS
jgi:hypothetical protein